jgi:hypothetical protein
MQRAALKKQVRLYLLAEEWVIEFALNSGVSVFDVEVSGDYWQNTLPRKHHTSSA